MPNWSPRRFVFYRKAVFPAQRRSQDENRGKRNDPTLVERPGTAFWRERRLRRLLVYVVGDREGGGMGESQKGGSEEPAAHDDRERDGAGPDGLRWGLNHPLVAPSATKPTFLG